MISPMEPHVATVLRDGVLNVRKEAGWTSHDVVARIRGKLHGTKVGHAGTLDPEAIGVLPLLVGRGTRIAEYLLEWDKTYLAVLRLGESTDTQDAAGVVLRRLPVDSLEEDRIREVIAGFEGRIQQTPPMYSAVKVGGIPLYKAARAGRDITRQPREVTVFHLDIVGIQIPDVTIRVACSKGTYIRTLCADIGERLDVGGHMKALVRERVGPLTVKRALTVGEIESRLERGTLAESMLTLDEALADLPSCIVRDEMARQVLHGMPIAPSEILTWDVSKRSNRAVRIKDESGRLLAIGTLPAGMDMDAHRLNAQAVAVSKVLITE
jgi:tRNA pseudouridine55 synthase